MWDYDKLFADSYCDDDVLIWRSPKYQAYLYSKSK